MAKFNHAVGKAVVPNERRRSISREKLLSAAIEILRTEGLSALNTVSITGKAGLAQSSFYLHFKDLDECVQAAAESIAEDFRRFITEHRRQIYQVDPDNLNLLKDHLREILSIWENERHIVEIYARFRYDSSVVGLCMRNLHEQFVDDLTEDFQNILASKNLESDIARTRLLATLIISNISAAGELVLEGKINNQNEAASFLAIALQALFYAYFGQNRADK